MKTELKIFYICKKSFSLKKMNFANANINKSDDVKVDFKFKKFH